METKFFFKNLELVVFDSVYAPSDDSLLLANALAASEVAEKVVLDLGCGSGIQGINALSLGAKKVFFTDLDASAVANARENAKAAGFRKKSVFKKSSIFSALRGKRFDLIIFNPPYVDSGKKRKWLDTDGGKKGREVLDKFLLNAKNHLNKNGLIFFVQSSLNGERKTKQLLKQIGFSFKIVSRKRLFFEELIVFKAQKK